MPGTDVLVLVRGTAVTAYVTRTGKYGVRVRASSASRIRASPTAIVMSVEVNLRNSARKGDASAVRLVLSKHRVNVDSTTGDPVRQWTALHEAAFAGHSEICAILIRYGAKLDRKTSEKKHGACTALHLAAYNVRR